VPSYNDIVTLLISIKQLEREGKVEMHKTLFDTMPLLRAVAPFQGSTVMCLTRSRSSKLTGQHYLIIAKRGISKMALDSIKVWSIFGAGLLQLSGAFGDPCRFSYAF
jgi:hypothetical protein